MAYVTPLSCKCLIFVLLDHPNPIHIWFRDTKFMKEESPFLVKCQEYFERSKANHSSLSHPPSTVWTCVLIPNYRLWPWELTISLSPRMINRQKVETFLWLLLVITMANVYWLLLVITMANVYWVLRHCDKNSTYVISFLCTLGPTVIPFYSQGKQGSE